MGLKEKLSKRTEEMAVEVEKRLLDIDKHTLNVDLMTIAREFAKNPRDIALVSIGVMGVYLNRHARMINELTNPPNKMCDHFSSTGNDKCLNPAYSSYIWPGKTRTFCCAYHEKMIKEFAAATELIIEFTTYTVDPE